MQFWNLPANDPGVITTRSRGQRSAAVGSGRDRDSNRCPRQMAASVNRDRDPGQSQLTTAAAPDR